MKNNLTGSTIIKVGKENKGFSLLLFAVIVAGVFASLIPPQLLKKIVDRNLTQKTTEGLLTAAVCYLGVLILIGLLDFVKGGLLTVLGQKIVKKLRMELTLKTERMGTSYFNNHASGEITSRFTNDVDNVNSLFADGVVSMLADCCKIVGIIASIWIFSSKLGILTLLLVPVLFGITRAFQKRMLSAQVENLEQIGRVNAHISESLKNIRMIKAFSKEAYMERLYDSRLEDNFQTVNKVNFYDSCYAPIIQIIRAVLISIVVLMASDKLTFIGTGMFGISLGMAAASIDLISNLFSPIETLGMELQNIQKGLSGVRRLNDFYKEKEDLPKLSISAKELIEKGNGEFNFTNLSFSYDAETEVLKDITFSIKKGEHVTFIGRTGVGKTTLFRLIMGLLTPTQGHITFSGAEVSAIPNSQKRRLFGYVEQQFEFIRGTVLDQITLKDPQITRSQVEEAMKFVGLHNYILRLEKGYDTIVNEKTDFSQGQRELLAIARAVVMNPAVLLLDEITANLDSKTQEQIVEVLSQAKSGRTVLSISHRVGAIGEGDRIVELL